MFGQRFSVPEAPVERLLSGRKLLIKNTVPDNKERNNGIWLLKDASIVAGTRETPDDPRCNGDPAGTIRASIRFFSNHSEHDTGVIDLPCENWSALGPDVYPNAVRLGYKYRDRELDEGPCKKVILRHGRLVKASCYGKGASTDFLHDLVQGTDEGIVNVVLSVGLIKYCTAFDGFRGRDVRDGKSFVGRDSPALLWCPELPAPGCGDGVIEGEEECDDGNTVDGDCCRSIRRFEPAGSGCDDGDACTAVDECQQRAACSTRRDTQTRFHLDSPHADGPGRVSSRCDGE